MTEAEARETILANGYIITLEKKRSIIVWEAGRRGRQWAGINFLDLVQTFHLDKRKARNAA